VIAGRAQPPARRALALAVLAAVACATAAGSLIAPAAVLMAAPTLVLTLALMAGWMPGETTIARWRTRGTRSRRRRPNAPVRVAAAHTSARRPGGRIVICFSLANRPPPLPTPPA
jgi:hypothetical protein